MVRLKVKTGKTDEKNVLTFQFQYGAIKRKAGRVLSLTYLEFQFQYGAIKSTRPVVFPPHV